MAKPKLKVAVLISGSGTNLQALMDACAKPDFPAEIVAVMSNKADAYGLERAEKAGISTCIVSHKDYSSREKFDKALYEAIIKTGAEFICLAGFMRLLTKEFVEKWEGRIINVHPSLLPSFKGANAHRDALAAGVKITGCTIHFVVPEMDSGPIIVQGTTPVHRNDTEESLGARVLEVEHKCYPMALKLIAEGKVSLDGDRVNIKDCEYSDSIMVNPNG